MLIGANTRARRLFTILIILVPWSVFLLSYRLRLEYPSTITTVLHLFPVISASLWWGWKGGIITAAMLIAANICTRLLYMPGTYMEMLDPERIVSWTILAAGASVLGYFRNTIITSRRAIGDLEVANKRLSTALSEIKELTGLLPICASCKSIRDDKGYWKKVEVYLAANSDVRFSHSICPECEKKLYGSLAHE